MGAIAMFIMLIVFSVVSLVYFHFQDKKEAKH